MSTNFSENGGWSLEDGIAEHVANAVERHRDHQIESAGKVLLDIYQRRGARWFAKQVADWAGQDLKPTSDDAATLWSAIQDYAEPGESPIATVSRVATWLYRQVEHQKTQGAA